MTDVASHIRNLLYYHNCVIVPGLGGFLANYQPARMHPTSYIFNSPAKSIAFNVNLTGNDGLLANSIVSSDYINIYDAEKYVTLFVIEIKTVLATGEAFKIPEVGRLLKDREGHIIFLPDPSNDYFLQSFGLQAIKAEPVLRSKQTVADILKNSLPVLDQTDKKGQKVSNRFIALSAAAILLIVFFIQIFVQVQVKGNQYADVFGVDSFLNHENIVGVSYVPTITGMQDYFLKYYRPTTLITDSLLIIKAELYTDVLSGEEVLITNKIAESRYWLIAGAYGKKEFAQRILFEISITGYNADIIERNGLFMVALNVPYEDSNKAFRSHFISKTGINDAWILKK